LFISLTSGIELLPAKLLYPLVKLPYCPVVPDMSATMQARTGWLWVSYFGYELSPRPKVVNLTVERHDGGSFFLKRLRQKPREFCGISP
jgi:hypothetical protein